MTAASAASSDAESIIRHRVLSRDAELLPLLHKLGLYCRSSSSEAHESLMSELLTLSASVSRASLCLSALDASQLQLRQAKAAVSAAIADSQRRLQSLRLELQQAASHRRHQEECEQLLRLITAHQQPSVCPCSLHRRRGARTSAALEEEQRGMQAEEEEERRRQFSSVMLALSSVRLQWKADGR